MKIRNTSLLSLLVGGTFFACSIVNAPDDLIPPGDGDGDGDGDLGGSGPGDGDGDEGSGGGMGDGDGDMIDPPSPPTTGLIVVAGVDTDTDDGVLSVLDAVNGAERNRETLPAASIAYDEKEGRLVWFVFTSARPDDPGANTLAELQMRWYFDETDEWVTLSKTSALPPPLLRGNQGANPGPTPTSAFNPVVLNDRLAYISQTVVMGNPAPAITILDTSDLEDVTVQQTIPVPMMDSVVGIVGRRGTELDPDAVGGSVSVMVRNNCNADADPACDLIARPITIGNNVSELTPNLFGPMQGIPAFASTPVLPDAVARPFKANIDSLGAYAIAFNPGGDPRWWQFDPANPMSKSAPSSLPELASTSFSSFAVSECFAAGIAGDATAQELQGIHLANGNVLTTMPSYGDTAADVLIEPFRRNALTLRSTGAEQPTVRAFQIEQIGGVGNEQISLAERSVWNAPEDIDPYSFAVRRPPSPNCN